MPPISATLITRNEAAGIARALRSLSMADEILVVDSGSTDETCAIARSLGARVLHHTWEGYAAQKNFAVHEARHNWILSLDADEALDARAQAAIDAWKQSAPLAAGYRIARRAHYLGRWIRHSGWYPDYKIRLFDRHHARWVGDYVHESVDVRGRVETLPGEILHYTCNSLEDHRARIESYTDLAAAQMMAQGKSCGVLRRLVEPPWVFMQAYLFRLGFLDGMQGYWIARMAARYVARKQAKLIQLATGRGMP